jgi:hypothetical protein
VGKSLHFAAQLVMQLIYGHGVFDLLLLLLRVGR